MSKEYVETEILEEIKSNLLPELLRNKKRMEAIAQLSESGSMENLDAYRLHLLLDRLAPEESAQEEKSEQPQFASEIEIASKLILLKKDLTESPVGSLNQLIKAIEKHFKDTGYKMPVNRENDTNNAIHAGVSDEDFANSFPISIKGNEHAVVLKNNGCRSVVVARIGPSGQRIPVAF